MNNNALWCFVVVFVSSLIAGSALGDGDTSVTLRRTVDLAALGPAGKATVNVGEIRFGQKTTVEITIRHDTAGLELRRVSSSCGCAAVAASKAQEDMVVTTLDVSLQKFKPGDFNDAVFMVFEKAHHTAERKESLIVQLNVIGVVAAGDRDYVSSISMISLEYIPAYRHVQTFRLSRADEEPFKVGTIQASARWIQCSIDQLRSNAHKKLIDVVVDFGQIAPNETENDSDAHAEMITVSDERGKDIYKLPVLVELRKKPRVYPDTFFYELNTASTAVEISIYTYEDIKGVMLESSSSVHQEPVRKVRDGHYKAELQVPVAVGEARKVVPHRVFVVYRDVAEPYDITLCQRPKGTP